MLTMNDFVDLRMQQHIAHEIYRHQIMQRIPDPFPQLLPIPIPRHVILPPRESLPGVEATLQNDDLWKQFHQIGTEMIITKSGRRMFPSMRLSLSGLEDELNYCVLLEMVPIGDSRYKFSGSHWVPAGGAEPQSPQRMFLHTDSPASGAHWQAQPILFNKVKLTNNTLDSNGHIVLASMHKYQPRIHIIRTSDPTQIPWSPQQAFVFPETEFVAVTAYQNDRITKLKIDNNPFAKGFRETGQSRCKRKMSASPEIQSTSNVISPHKTNSLPSPSSYDMLQNEDHNESPALKRIRSNESTCSASSLDEVGFLTSTRSNSTSGQNSPTIDLGAGADLQIYQQQPPPPPRIDTLNESTVQNMQTFMNPSFVDLAYSYFERSHYPVHMHRLGSFCQQPNKMSFCLETSENEKSETSTSNGEVFNNSTTMAQTEASQSEAGAGALLRASKSNNFSISAILGSKS